MNRKKPEKPVYIDRFPSGYIVSFLTVVRRLLRAPSSRLKGRTVKGVSDEV